MGRKSRGSAIAVFFIALIALSTVALAHWGKADPSPDVYNSAAAVAFLVDLLAVAGLVAGVGYAVTGSVTGVAINGLNQYSLSRLQMAAWTIVVLAALFTYAKLNLMGYFGMPSATPLDIGIPSDLLVAMSIATFTTSAVPAILALKQSQDDPSPEEKAAAASRFSATTGTPVDEVTTSGKVIGRSDRNKAAWIDIFTGDEAANAGIVDISKVQQFLVTLLLIGVYIWSVVHALGVAKSQLKTLPGLSDDFIKLLALSHAGYLAYKVAPKAASDTDTTPAKPA